jgi:hypothetical protein
LFDNVGTTLEHTAIITPNSSTLRVYLYANDVTITYTELSVIEIIPTDITYSLEESFSQLVPLDKLIVQADLDYLDANPDALMDMHTGRETHTALSFDETNFEHFYPGNDKASGATVQDIKGTSDITITNYTADCRTTLANVNYGASDLLVKQDATGGVTAKADANTIEFNSDSGKVVKIPTRTRTANITIEITPDTVESILLVDTATGDITMNANGTVTASSGSVLIDTTTVQAGVKSIITVTGISISGESTLFAGLDGRVHQYTEETA